MSIAPKKKLAMVMNANQFQYGFGLIEVLITMLLLATTLLALSGLQARSLMYNHSSYLRSQANILAYNIIDRMRINIQATPTLSPSDFNITFAQAAPTGVSASDTSLREWRTDITNSIPGGSGELNCVATTRVCTVSIRWAESNNSTDAQDDQSQFTYMVRL